MSHQGADDSPQASLPPWETSPRAVESNGQHAEFSHQRQAEITGRHAADPADSTDRVGARKLAERLPVLAALFLIIIALWLAYLRESHTVPVNSDGAAQALQAWDMLHGNLLLRGWSASDVSFYTTELPEYMVVEAIRGLSADVVHIAAATTYTLLVLLTALLAKGRATGRQAAIRMLLATGIVLAPQVGAGAYILLLSPDHVGSAVVMLAILLVLDRAGRRMWVPALVGLLLTLLVVADGIGLYTGVAPLLVVCGVRVYRDVVMRRQPLADSAFEIALGAAAAVATVLASAILTILHTHGGLTVWNPTPGLAGAAAIPNNFAFGVAGIAALFGFDFFGMPIGHAALIALSHLAGAAVAFGAVWLALRGFLRETNLLIQVLVAGVVISLFGYLVSTSVVDAPAAREMVAILPFSAVLAGRLFADKIAAARLTPLLAAGLLAYTVTLGYYVTRPAQPAANSGLTAWLTRHHYTYGLAGYWDANVVTLTSGARVDVRAVCFGQQSFTTDMWESQASWYDSRLHDANFLVMDPGASYGDGSLGMCRGPTFQQVDASFGAPAHVYRVGSDTVLVWKTNLLTRVHKQASLQPAS
jgi:hypothetical protein